MLRGLNACEHSANRINHGQQAAGDFSIQRELAIAQPGEQAFPRVRQLLQPREAEKSTAPFDGVNRPENAGEQLLGRRITLQFDQFLVEPIQVFIALDKKILNDFVHSPFPPGLPFRAARLRFKETRARTQRRTACFLCACTTHRHSRGTT